MLMRNQNKIFFLFVSVFVLFLNPGILESKPLEEIFELALDVSSKEPNVISGRIDVESIEADLSASRRARLPVFNASIVNALMLDRKISDRNSLRKFEDDGLDLRVQMVQPIFTGFRIQSDINRNKARLSGQVLQANKRFSETIIEATIAYINYNAALKFKNQVNTTLTRAKRIVDLEEKRFNAGLTDLSIYSQIKVKLSEIQLLYNRSENELFSYEAAFRRFFDTSINPTGEVTSYRDFNFDGYDSDNISYDLETAKYELESAKADLQKSRGDGLPSVALTVTGTLYDVDGSSEEEDEYDVKGGLQASWQFLDFGANRKRVSAKRSTVNSVRYRIDYQRRIDEVEKLSLLSNISSIYKQLNDQYQALDDLNNQANVLQAQLTSAQFIGVSFIDLLFQINQIQRNINMLEAQYVQVNLSLKLISQNLQNFVITKAVNN